MGYIIVSWSYYKALRHQNNYGRVSAAFFMAWSGMAVIAALITLGLGLGQLFQAVVFDMILLNQV